MGSKRKRQTMGKWDELVERAKGKIPKVAVILDEAWATLPLSEGFIRTDFGEALRRIDEKATTIYFGYEHRAMEFATQGWLGHRRDSLRDKWNELATLLQEQGWEAFKARATALFMDFAELVQQLEKDLGNMRKGVNKIAWSVPGLKTVLPEVRCERRRSAVRRFKRTDPPLRCPACGQDEEFYFYAYARKRIWREGGEWWESGVVFADYEEEDAYECAECGATTYARGGEHDLEDFWQEEEETEAQGEEREGNEGKG